MPEIDGNLKAALADRYVIERELGRGGMATVYLAHDLRHQRAVALKVLHPELAQALGSERFLREIRIAAHLQHSNILPLFDSGTADGLPYYTMPYVDGESLRTRITRERQLGVENALQITREVAAALGHAHAGGIVHRDIKPENILLARDGQALVADFGIARAVDAAGSGKLTETGLALGTPAYMSPEQAAGDGQLDSRSDIYALGCILYEMLAGQPPFTGGTAQAILARHAVDPVPSLRTVRATVPPAVEHVITKALAKVPADRFATAGEFADALTGSPAGVPASDTTKIALRRSLPTRSILLGAAAGALMIGLAMILWPSAPAKPTNPNLVAVLPFRVVGAAPELRWLGEGLVDLLAIKLGSEGGMRAAEPRAVLSAWHRLVRSGEDLPPEGALKIASTLGAGRVIDGGVIGTAGHLTFTASLTALPGGRTGARASVEGPVDSLPVLVDRLAAQLLGLRAGVEAHQLSSLTSSSREAIQAYLAGRVAFRRGRVEEAVRRFEEATRLDSTFALAALDLKRAAAWGGSDEEQDARATRLAWAWRSRLSPADRALLEVAIGQWSTAPEMFERWRLVVSAYPDRPEVWYGLGDAYYHWGALAGLDGSLEQAAEAFRRGWQIDSTTANDSTQPEHSPVFAEPLTHMVELAQVAGDTAEVRRLVALGVAADSTSDQGWYLRWHQAAALGDSGRRAFWARPDIAAGALGRIHWFTMWTGVAGGPEAQSALEERGPASSRNESWTWFSRYVTALNGGQPSEAPPKPHDPDRKSDDWFRTVVLQALFWDGDSAVAARASRKLAASAQLSAASKVPLREQYQNMCVVGQWRIAHRQTQDVDSFIRRLRSAHLPGVTPADSAGFMRYTALCTTLLEAMQASLSMHSGLRARVERLDSLARTFIIEVCCGGDLAGTNLVIARLAEAQGDLPRALRAVRRRTGGYMLGPILLSTFLREEGRLAALTGDTAGAIRAYHHYLALRPNPEPRLKAEVGQAQADLMRLLGEHPKP